MAGSLQEATITALKAHPPFDQMGSKSLNFLAAQLQLAYYPRGTVVLAPESGAAPNLYILKQGRVRGSASGALPGAGDVTLGAGESFPIGALVAHRAVAYPYTAEEDCFCWELPTEAFDKLMARSARFRAYCTSYLSTLVEQSHRALRAEASDLVAGGMLRPLRDILSRAPVSCAPETPVREVLKRMHELRIGSMIVAAADGVPLGIFTTLDVLERVALPQADVGAPISGLMSGNVVSLEEEEPVLDAALAMVREGIRHVVVTRDGRLAGVVSERDLFGMQRSSLRRIVERVALSATVAELAEAAADVRGLARALLAQGVPAEHLTQMTCALNDSITQRAIQIMAPKYSLPGEWCWLALGSEGRMEQTLVTDQDNALIIEAGKEAFLAFADQVNRNLDACGFPLCKGDIMARNPRWCLPLEGWRRVFDDWIRNNDPQALLNASIFFDFRALAGDARLAGALRDGVLAQTKANRAFCRALAQAALQTRPPLGLLADFSADELDLKALGARPFVDAARVLALAAGSPETATAARLQAAGEKTAVEAFHFVQTLRLRREGNRIRPGELNDIDRRVLKEAFRQASMLQQRLRLDLGL